MSAIMLPDYSTVEQPWPRVLPARWRQVDSSLNGATFESREGLRVLCSAMRELDGRVWLHVSVSRRDRMPSWEELKHVKETFIGDERKAIQVLPAAAEYVNIHPRCLHLWACLDGDPLPDFTRGTGQI